VARYLILMVRSVATPRVSNHEDPLVMPRVCEASSMLRRFGSSTDVSGILDRPVKPGDDGGENGRTAGMTLDPKPSS
jgi:hypothetical protein